MTDRKPGAPGQFKALITQAQLQKLQSGEQFVLTLTRDDQPITEGTPYSKAAVLPDELAARLCPDVLDPTPADALAALLPLNGNAAMAGDLPMGGNKITGLGTPTADADASTKKYVDDGLGGKAASSHNHSAANITSGTLGVARGGTGKATHTGNAVLTGNGTSAVNNVATASGALYATAANGAAKFGTLPIAQGGTGATSAADACTALGLSPVMNAATEYATREKYKGKQVYAKLIEIGSISAGSTSSYANTTVAMGSNILANNVIDYNIFVKNGNDITRIPYFSSATLFMDAWLSNNNIVIRSWMGTSGVTAFAIVKYFK